MHEVDQKFMREALLEAKKAFDIGEVPIGAVLVLNGKIISRGYNIVEKEQNASCHAELLCLQRGANILSNWRLLGTTLYSTLEPCAMCAGAMALFRIKRLVYGASDFRHGANGSVFDILNRKHPIHQIEVTHGVGEEEGKKLLKKFFQERRRECSNYLMN